MVIGPFDAVGPAQLLPGHAPGQQTRPAGPADHAARQGVGGEDLVGHIAGQWMFRGCRGVGSGQPIGESRLFPSAVGVERLHVGRPAFLADL